MKRIFDDEAVERVNNMKLEDTVNLMLSDSYELRFMAEYVQLGIRACKLEQTIRKCKQGKSKFVLNCPIEVLEEQLECMVAYLATLQRRDIIEHITEKIEKSLKNEGE